MRKRFRSILDKAYATNQLPTPTKRLPRKVDSRENVGEQVRVRIHRILSPDSVEDVLYRVDQAARRLSGAFAIWYASASFATFGERLVGSGIKLLRLDPDDEDASLAPNFHTSFDNTGVWPTRQGMMEALRTMLEDYAGSLRTTIYLLHVKIMNFSRRGRT